MELFRSFKYLPLRVALIFALGVYTAHQFEWLSLYQWLGIFLGSLIAGIFLNQFLWLSLFAGSVLYTSLREPVKPPFSILHQKSVIFGEIEENNRKGGYHILRIDSLKIKEEIIKLKTHAIIYIQEYTPEGTYIKVEGELLPLSFSKNEGTREKEKYYERKGVFLKLKTHDYARVIKRPEGWLKLVENIRGYIIESSEAYLSENGKYVVGMLLGEKGGFSPQEFDELKKVGILHIFAVSGLHVGVFVFVIFTFLKILRTREWIIILVLGILLLLYAGVVRFRPSVIRASIMSYILAISFLFERKVLPLVSLSVAFFLILFISPSSLWDIGFQLSFGATFGIIGAIRIFPYMVPKNVLLKGLSYIYHSTLISLFAFLFTLPLSSIHFKYASFIAPLSNLLVVPLVGLIIPGAFLFLLLNPLCSFLAHIFADGVWLMVEGIKLYVKEVSLLDFQWVYLKLPFWFCILPYLLLVIFYVYKNKKPRLYASFLFLVALNILIFQELWLKKELDKFAVLDTYYGDVIVIKLNGKNLMVNAGSKKEPITEEFLDAWNIQKIDLLLLPTKYASNNSGVERLKDKIKKIIELEEHEKVKVRIGSSKIEIFQRGGKDFSLTLKNKEDIQIITGDFPITTQKFIYLGKDGEELKSILSSTKAECLYTKYPLIDSIPSIKEMGGRWMTF